VVLRYVLISLVLFHGFVEIRNCPLVRLTMLSSSRIHSAGILQFGKRRRIATVQGRDVIWTGPRRW